MTHRLIVRCKGLFIVVAIGMCWIVQPMLWAMDPCDADRSKVCGGISAGDGRIHDCMMGQLNKLAPACQKIVKKADELNQNMEHLCANDIRNICAQYAARDRDSLIQCLQKRHAQITESCRKAFDDYKALGYRVRQ